MISDNLAKQLHDKATRGELLSAEDQAQLENWYALQDNAENKALGLMGPEKNWKLCKPRWMRHWLS